MRATVMSGDSASVTAWNPGVPGISEVLHARHMQHAYPMHSHDAWTLLMVDRGTVVYDLARSRHTTAPRTLTVLPPDVSHDGQAAGSDGYRKRVVYLDREMLGDASIGSAVDSPALVDPLLYDRMDALHAALSAGPEPLEAESRLALIAERIRDRWGRAPESSGAGGGARLAGSLRELLDERVQPGISLAEAAARLEAGAPRLIRSFTARYGIPPHAYLTGRRVELARRHLLSGRSAADAAVLAGFYDQSHLTRHFKRVVGITPSAFAASHRSLR